MARPGPQSPPARRLSPRARPPARLSPSARPPARLSPRARPPDSAPVPTANTAELPSFPEPRTGWQNKHPLNYNTMSITMGTELTLKMPWQAYDKGSNGLSRGVGLLGRIKVFYTECDSLMACMHAPQCQWPRARTRPASRFSSCIQHDEHV